mgnify:CR=1 FL=1
MIDDWVEDVAPQDVPGDRELAVLESDGGVVRVFNVEALAERWC